MSSLLLLSGGMDSIALMYWKQPTYALTIDYGQKSAKTEILNSRACCDVLGVKHIIAKIDCSEFGGGVMVNNNMSTNSEAEKAPEWWPFRNQLLITLAAAKAIQLECKEIQIGTVKSDALAHKDGSFEFINRINDLLTSQEGKISLVAPALDMTTQELIYASGATSDYMSWAHSCHISNNACGHCRGCNKQTEVLKALGWKN